MVIIAMLVFVFVKIGEKISGFTHSTLASLNNIFFHPPFEKQKTSDAASDSQLTFDEAEAIEETPVSEKQTVEIPLLPILEDAQEQVDDISERMDVLRQEIDKLSVKDKTSDSNYSEELAEEPENSKKDSEITKKVEDSEKTEEQEQLVSAKKAKKTKYPSVNTVPDSPKILITEIQIEGDKASNDFIELYNPSAVSADISRFQLKKRTKAGVESSIKVFSEGSRINAKGFFLWANSEDDFDSSVFADVSSSSYLTENNSVALFDRNDNIIDKVAWGFGQENPFVESYIFPQNPGKNQSVSRKKDEAGIFVDTDDNSWDFFIELNTNPKGVVSDRTPSNIPVILSHSDSQWINSSQTNLFGTAEPGSLVSVFINSESFSTPSNEDGLWQFTISLAEGENKLALTAQDGSGNKSEELHLSLFLDTKPPQVSFGAIPYFQESVEFSLSWQAIDPLVAVTSSGIDGFSIFYAATPSTLDGISLQYQDKEVGFLDWNQEESKYIRENSINLLGQDGDTYVFTVKARDKAGNESEPMEVLTEVSVLKNILITEVQIEGDSVNQDYVRFYNPNPYDVNLGDYRNKYLRLVKRSKTSSSDTTIKSWNRDSETKIRGQRYFLWASSRDENYPGLVHADCSTSQYLSADNGIGLRIGEADTGELIDALGWGSFQNILFEGSAFSQNPGKNSALMRKYYVEDQSYQDTNNNLEDFSIEVPSQTMENP